MMKGTVLAGLGLMLALGGCSSARSPSVAYTTPGWYLEKPRFLLATGPEIFAGPFTYEQCEAERTKLADDTSRRMLCIMERVRPGTFGPYSPMPPNPTTANRSS